MHDWHWSGSQCQYTSGAWQSVLNATTATFANCGMWMHQAHWAWPPSRRIGGSGRLCEHPSPLTLRSCGRRMQNGHTRRPRCTLAQRLGPLTPVEWTLCRRTPNRGWYKPRYPPVMRLVVLLCTSPHGAYLRGPTKISGPRRLLASVRSAPAALMPFRCCIHQGVMGHASRNRFI